MKTADKNYIKPAYKMRPGDGYQSERVATENKSKQVADVLHQVRLDYHLMKDKTLKKDASTD